MIKMFQTFILLACSIIPTYGQEYTYTLNQFTSVLFNPGYAASDNEAYVSFLNRRVEVAPGLKVQTNIFNARFPFLVSKSGKRFGGFAFNVIQKDAGHTDLLKTLHTGISVAYNLHIAKEQFFSFGIQSNYNNRKTSIERLTTGSQWMASEFRFDGSASLGESIADNRVHYFSLNAGFLWYMEEKKSGRMKTFAGLSAFNMNQPNGSFFESHNSIPISFITTAGAVLYQSDSFVFSPQVIHQYSDQFRALNIIFSNKLLFTNKNPYDIIQSGCIELLGKYDLRKELSFGMVFHQPSVSFGISYNFFIPGNQSQQYFNNGLEFSVKLSRLLWKPSPKKVLVGNYSVITNRNFDFGNDRPKATVPGEKSDSEIIQSNIVQFANSKVTSVQFELDKDFKFVVGRTELNADATAYLDDLLILLQKNPEYNIEVIGHTDNEGRPLINYKLSSGRAASVINYLLQNGLAKHRARSKGMGDTQPLVPNDTEENKAKNRRVQLIIYINP